ncbi:MAG: hypothetical protein QG597_3105 [Actinomycetota bacterium]|nr:hypothetical protein [Actinomycetota bacterium]
MRHLRLEVPVAAPATEVFRAFTDWAAQGEWMLGTDVRPVLGDGRGVGGRIEAWTGVGRVGFLDTMVITEWDEPNRVVVRHTGRVVRGLGIMEVVERPDGTSVFVWAEELELPLGVLGRLGWPLVRPAFADGVRRSLRAFADVVESGRWSPQ